MNERLMYLRQRIAKGVGYLVYTNGVARLTNPDEMLDMGHGPIFYIHLGKALDDFAQQYDEDQTFAAHELQGIGGISYRQLNHWIDRGLFMQSSTPGVAPGSGRSRVFSWHNAFVMRVIGAFRQQGVTLEVVEKIARFLIENPEPKNPPKKRRK